MPRDGTATRDRILDSAERLVLQKGFAATSVDEVIAAAASSKGAFFHHFPSKNELGRALVARYAAADIAHLHMFMAAAEAETDDPGQQLLSFIRRFEEIADDLMAEQQSSCLYISFVYDRQLVVDGGTEVIRDAVQAWRDVLGAKLEAAAEAGTPADGFDLDALADHLFVTFEGAFILGRTMGETRHMRAQLRVLRQLLEAALGVSTARKAGVRAK
jgi:TetR/AcrR family transcriptional regulator, transcriptional repressor for nem operon